MKLRDRDWVSGCSVKWVVQGVQIDSPFVEHVAIGPIAWCCRARLQRVCHPMSTRHASSLLFISPLANIKITFIFALPVFISLISQSSHSHHYTSRHVMVFGLFTRKSTDDAEASPEKMNDQNTRLPTPTPSIASVARHSPLRFSLRAVLSGSTTGLTAKDSDLATESVAEGGNNVHSPAPPPSDTPSPPPVGPNALYDLMLTIPPKTLHAYTLAHLRPQPPLPSTSTSSPTLPDSAPRPPSPNTVTRLTTFFSTLAPPPLLHCMRCHKDFYDIENDGKDKACRVPHDDESALVSRVSGGGYETLWGCCGQTASGDGSEGPPDGWCYEGTHTVSLPLSSIDAITQL